MNKPLFWAKLPKAGLGNKLLVWARAATYARRYGGDLITTNWVDMNWGTYLRRERSKRLYLNYFRSQPISLRWRLFWNSVLGRAIAEPFEQMDLPRVYAVTQLFVKPDYFFDIRTERAYLRELLFQSIRPHIMDQYEQVTAPVIGVHIRRGDFKFGTKLTPLSFFIDGIHQIRSTCRAHLPVTVFSDASDDELAELLALPQVTRSKKQSDLLDMLQLSKSTIIFLSINSTFGYWSAFLSEALVVRSHEEYQTWIDRKADGQHWFEIEHQAGLPNAQLVRVLDELNLIQ